MTNTDWENQALQKLLTKYPCSNCTRPSHLGGAPYCNYSGNSCTPFERWSNQRVQALATWPIAFEAGRKEEQRRYEEIINQLTRSTTRAVKEAEEATAREIFEEMVCPMCYRLNPQHASMDHGKGCKSCEDKSRYLKGKEE